MPVLLLGLVCAGSSLSVSLLFILLPGGHEPRSLCCAVPYHVDDVFCHCKPGGCSGGHHSVHTHRDICPACTITRVLQEHQAFNGSLETGGGGDRGLGSVGVPVRRRGGTVEKRGTPRDCAVAPRGGTYGGLKGEQKPPNAEPERTQVGNNKNIGGGHGEEKTSGEKPRQVYRKIRLRTSVSSPFGASHNDALQGHTLSESEDEVTYTETDCISRLPMFRGNLVAKTTFRVSRSEDDPQNSVRIKVTVVVRDVKLIRGMGWLMSKAVQKSVRDGGKKQAANTLNAMVLEAKPEPELDGSGSQA